MTRFIKLMWISTLFVLLAVTGCTPYIYGVPQPQ